MGSRGRKSADELVQATAVVERIERPPAPAELTEEQGIEWARIVESYGADAFTPDRQPLLAAYCRHVVQARRIASMITEAERNTETTVREYKTLHGMHEKETRALSSLAVRLNFAKTTYRRADTDKKLTNRPPWEFD